MIETRLFVFVIKRRGDCPFNQRACIITTLIKAAKSLRCHLSSRQTGRMRFWLIPPCECVWVYDCPKDKSWQPSKECKNHNCTSSLQITILCRHNIWAAQAFPCKKACIFQRWSHLYSSLFCLLLYLSQWLMRRCGRFKCSMAPRDVTVSPAVTAGCWQRPVQHNRIFSLVQKLLSVIKSQAITHCSQKLSSPIVTHQKQKFHFITDNVTTRHRRNLHTSFVISTLIFKGEF